MIVKRLGRYIFVLDWIFFGIIEQYDGSDATAGLKLTRNKFHIGKVLNRG